MDTSTSTGRLLIAMRQQLKARGLHYRDVALRLKVSEGTVKRYFSGKGVSITVLEKLAATVDLDLLSLVTLAQQQNISEGALTQAQQAALRRSRVILAVFHLLNIGFLPTQIIQEFDLAKEIDAILARLQAWGLIRRLSVNGIKMLAKRKLWEKSDGPLREHHIDSAQQFLSEIDFHNEKCAWFYTAVRMSQASDKRVQELMNRFISDVQALGKGAIPLSRDETQWYRVFVGAEPVSRTKLLRRG